MTRVRRSGGAALLFTVAMAVVAGVLLGSVLTSAAQTDPPDRLAVRSIDGRDPDSVEVEFVWTGDRGQVTELVIREDGSVVDVSVPVRLDDEEPFGVVLAIDTSESMVEGAAFERARTAARNFVDEKAANDQVAVVGFGDVVQVTTGFTDDVDELHAAIDELEPVGRTALYDAVVRSVQLFDGSDLVPNVLLLTDGSDTSSAATEAVAAGELRDAGALLYGVAVETGELDVDAVERLASATGGSVLTSADPDDLTALYAEAQEHLRRQYRATFVSETERDGPSELTLTIGATSGIASFTPGARLDSAQLVEPVPAPSSGGIDFLEGELVLWIALALAGIAVAGTVFAVGSALTRDGPGLERVLQPYADGFVAPDDVPDDRLATTPILQRAVDLTGEFAQRRGVLERVEHLLERADLPLRAAEALFFALAAAIVLTLLGGMLGGVLGALAAFVVAGLTPVVIVLSLARKRHAQFQAQLPDMLGVLASTLRSGYSLMQGVEAAAQEVAEPTRRELQRVVTEERLGMRLEEALDNVAARMDSKDFGWAVMAIDIQREVGGNLAELLDVVSETMRERERLRRDIRALTAEGRMSAIVLAVLPVAVGVLIYTLNQDYIEGMLDRTIGPFLLWGALGLMGLGFLWMQRMIDIEV